MKVTFRELAETDPPAVGGVPNADCVVIDVDGRHGGYLIRDLPAERGGRWYCVAWPHWPKGQHLQAASLHGLELSRQIDDAQRFVTRQVQRTAGRA